MKKTINFLKSWIGRIATHPIISRAFHAGWQSALGILLALVQLALFANHPSGEQLVTLSAVNSTILSAIKTFCVQFVLSLRDQVTIPGEEA